VRGNPHKQPEISENKKPRFREATGGSANRGASLHREKRIDLFLYAVNRRNRHSRKLQDVLIAMRRAQKSPASARRAKPARALSRLSKLQPNTNALTTYTIMLGNSHQAMLILDLRALGWGL
jgi:hypothetical protein